MSEAGKGDANNRVKNWDHYRSEMDRIFKKGESDADIVRPVADESADKANRGERPKTDHPSQGSSLEEWDQKRQRGKTGDS